MSPRERRPATRSDSIRTSRTENTSVRVRQAAERARNPQKAPPVMSRTSMAGAPGTRKRVQTPVRRAKYYSLGTPGAEIRLPALPQLRPGWRLLSGTLAILLAMAAWAMWNADMFKIDTVRVVGAKRVTPSEINTVASLGGISILQADPVKLAKDLSQALPGLKTVEVQVGLPADVVVRVTERQPVLTWQIGEDLKWIDQDGYTFPAAGEEPGLVLVQAQGDPPGEKTSEDTKAADGNLPEVTDIRPKARPYLPPEMIDPILKMSKIVPAGSPVVYDPTYGVGWNDPQQGWKVYVGMDLKDMDLKLSQYQVISANMLQREIHPVMISVEFPQAPFYRLE